MPWRYLNIAAQGTTVVSNPPVDLIAVIVNTGAASAVATVSDGTSTSNAPVIATIDASATGNFFYNCECDRGITVALTGGTANLTVIYDTYGQGAGGIPADSEQT